MTTKTLSLGFLAALALAAPAPAAEFRGVVSRVDAQRNVLVVEGRGIGKRGLLLDFAVEPGTAISFGRDPGRLTDLVPGRTVRVSYELQGERRLATRINVSGSRPGAEVSPAPAPAPGAAPAAGGTTISGVLRRIALTDREIVVILPQEAGNELETTLAVAENVQVTRDRKPITLEQLVEGEQVAVRAEKRETGLVAVGIHVGGVPEAVAPPQENKIAKVRQILKTVDFFLQMAEQLQRK